MQVKVFITASQIVKRLTAHKKRFILCRYLMYVCRSTIVYSSSINVFVSTNEYSFKIQSIFFVLVVGYTKWDER